MAGSLIIFIMVRELLVLQMLWVYLPKIATRYDHIKQLCIYLYVVSHN